MNKEKNVKNIILFVQIILTLFGTGLAFILFFRTLKTPSMLGMLGSITYLMTYLAIIFYTVRNYNKNQDVYFKGVIYAYASVLGIQNLKIKI